MTARLLLPTDGCHVKLFPVNNPPPTAMRPVPKFSFDSFTEEIYNV